MIGNLLRFATVGLANTLVGYTVIFLCMYGFRMGPVASNVAGYACGLVCSFTLNRSYTFRSTTAAWPQALRFAASFVFAYSVNIAVLVWMTRVLDAHEGVSQVVAGASYTIVFFLLSNFFVFVEGRRK
ncbi:MAG: GtrA family protein [Alcaligenaceae bacterium]|nr:MAG: GtrA family protein [Alcaligenaceae bacterium]